MTVETAPGATLFYTTAGLLRIHGNLGAFTAAEQSTQAQCHPGEYDCWFLRDEMGSAGDRRIVTSLLLWHKLAHIRSITSGMPRIDKRGSADTAGVHLGLEPAADGPRTADQTGRSDSATRPRTPAPRIRLLQAGHCSIEQQANVALTQLASCCGQPHEPPGGSTTLSAGGRLTRHDRQRHGRASATQFLRFRLALRPQFRRRWKNEIGRRYPRSRDAKTTR